MDVTSALSTVAELPAPIRDVVFQGMVLGVNRDSAARVSAGLGEVTTALAVIAGRSKALSSRLAAAWQGESGQAVSQGYTEAGANATGQQRITRSLGEQNSSFIDITDYTNLNAIVMGFVLLATAGWQLATMEVGEAAEAAAARAALEKALAECEARVAAEGAEQEGLRALAARALEPLWGLLRTAGKAFLPELNPGMGGWAIARGVTGKVLLAGQGGLVGLGVQLYLDGGQLAKVDWGLVADATEGSVLGFVGGDLLARGWGAAVDGLLGRGEQGVVAGLRRSAVRVKTLFGVDLSGQDVEERWLARRLSSDARQRAGSWLDAGVAGLSGAAAAGRRVIVPLAVGGLGGVGGGLAAGVGQAAWGMLAQHQKLSWTMALQVLDSGISGLGAGAAGAVFHAAHGFWHPGTDGRPVDVGAALREWTEAGHTGDLPMWVLLPDADGVLRLHELTLVARGTDENGEPVIGFSNRGLPPGAFVDHLRAVEDRDGYQAAVRLVQRAQGIDPARLHSYFERYFGASPSAVPPASEVPMGVRVQERLTDAVLFGLFPPVHLGDIAQVRAAVADSYAPLGAAAARPGSAAEQRYVEQFHRVFEPIRESASVPRPDPLTPDGARAVVDALAAVAAAPGREAVEGLVETALHAVAAPHEAAWLPTYAHTVANVLTPDAVVRDAAGARAVAKRLLDVGDERDALAAFRLNRDVVNQAITHLRAEATAPAGAAARPDNPPRAAAPGEAPVVAPSVIVDGAPLIAGDNARMSVADCLDRVERALALWSLQDPAPIAEGVPRDVALMRRLEHFRAAEPGILPDGQGPAWVLDRLSRDGDTAVLLVRRKGTSVWHAYAVSRTGDDIIVADSGRQFDYLYDPSGAEPHRGLPLPDGVTSGAELETAVAMFDYQPDGLHPNPRANWAGTVELRELDPTDLVLGTGWDDDDPYPVGRWPFPPVPDPALTDGETLAAHLAAGRKVVVQLEIPMADILHGYPGQYEVTVDLLDQAGGLNGLQHDLRGAAEAVRQLRSVGGKKLDVDVAVEVVIDPRRPGGGDYRPDQVERFRRSVSGLIEESAAARRRGSGGRLGLRDALSEAGGGARRDGSGGSGSADRHGPVGLRGALREAAGGGQAGKGSGGSSGSGGRHAPVGLRNAMREASGKGGQPSVRPGGGHSPSPDPGALTGDAPRPDAYRVGDMVDAFADHRIPGVGEFRWEFDDDGRQTRFVLEPDPASRLTEPVELWTGDRTSGNPTWQGNVLGNLRAGLLDGVVYRVVSLHPSGSDPTLMATLRSAVEPIAAGDQWLLRPVRTPSARASGDRGFADAVSDQLGFPHQDRRPDRWAGSSTRLGAGRPRLAADDAQELTPRRPRPTPQRLAAGEYLAPEGRRQLPIVARPTTPEPPLIRPAPDPVAPAPRASVSSAPRPLPGYGSAGDAEDAARSLAARRDSVWAGLVTDNPRLVSASDAPSDSHARDEWLRLLERLHERGVDATALGELDHVIRAHSDALAQLAALDPRRAAALTVDDLRHDIRGVAGGRLSSTGDFTPDELDAAMAGVASQPEILRDLRQLAPHFREAIEQLRALDAAEAVVLPVPGMVDAAGTQQALGDIQEVAQVGAPPLAVTRTPGGGTVDAAEFQRAAGGRLEPVPGGLPEVVRHIQTAVADSPHANAAGAALIVVEGGSGTTPGQPIVIRPATPGDDPIRPQPGSPDSARTGLYLAHNGLAHEIRDVNGEFDVVLRDGRLYPLEQWPGQRADGTWFDVTRASAVYYSGDVAHRLPAEHQPESAVATPQAIVGSDSWAGDHEHFVEDLGPMAAVTEISAGHHRTADLPQGRNEDGLAYAVVYREGNPVYLAVVCDGVSRSTNPHEAAHTGAWTALEHLMHAVPLSDDYETAAAEAIQAAQNDVVAIPTKSGYQNEDGPPAAAIRLMILDPSKADGDNLVTAGLGDVREYWLSAQPEESRLLSRDHSIVPGLVDHGMSEAEALQSPWAHNVEHSLGGTNPALPTDRGTYVTSCRVEGSGVLLVCSDGMWGKTHSAEDLARAVQGHDTPVQKVVALRDLALGKGEHDNITGLVIEIPPTAPLADPQLAVEVSEPAGVVNDGSAQSAGAVSAVAVAAGADEPAERGCADVSLTDFHGLAPGVVSELPSGAGRRGVEVNAVDVLRAAGGVSVYEPGDLPGAVEHVLQNGDPGGGAALVLVAYSQTAGHILQVRPALPGDDAVAVGESERRRFRETGLHVVDGNVENGRPREIVRDTRTGSLFVARVDESPSALEHLARPPHGCAAIYYAGAPGSMTPEHPLTGSETFSGAADLWYSGAPSADAAGSARPTYRTAVEAGAALGWFRQRRDELAGALGVERPLNSRDVAGWRRGLDAVRARFVQRPDEVAGRVGVTPEQLARQLDALGDVLNGHQDAVAQLERVAPRNAAAAALADAWRDVMRVVEGTGMLGPGDLSLTGLPAVLAEWRSVPAVSGGYLDNLRRLAPDYLLAAERVRSANEQDAAQSAATAEPPADAGRVPVAEIYAERDRAEAEHAAALRARHVFQDGPLQVTDAALDTDPTGVVDRLRRTRPEHQEQVQALADAAQRTAEARARLDGIDQQIAARQWRIGATNGSAEDVAALTCVNGHLISASETKCPTCSEQLATWQGDRDIALVSHRGKHARNEDAVRAAKVGNVRVAAIGDGVSDSSDGQLAARAATTSLVDRVSADLGAGLDPGPALRNGLIAAQDGAVAVGAGYAPPALPSGESDPNWLGPPMSTIVGATVTDLGKGQAVVDVVWIGDSRGYWIPAAGPHEQLTIDDSEEVEFEAGKRGKALSYWLGSSGSGDDRRVYGAVAEAAADDSHTRQVTVTGPGWVVLATDGVFNKMSPTAMAETLGRHGGSLLDAAVAVVAAATSSDDKSLVVVPVGIDSGAPTGDAEAATLSADPVGAAGPGSGSGWLHELES